MLKGRLWRFLLFFCLLYLTFFLIFFRSFNSDEKTTTTTSPLPQAHVIGVDDQEPKNVQHHVVARESENNDQRLSNLEEDNNKNLQSNLEPVMTKGQLGNYEQKNIVKSSGPGEDGEGVQLHGEEERKRGEQSVAEYGFNEVASDKISLDRRARDTRYEREMPINRGTLFSLDLRNVNIGIIPALINYPQLLLFLFFMMKDGQH